MKVPLPPREAEIEDEECDIENRECDCILCTLFNYNPLWILTEIVGEV